MSETLTCACCGREFPFAQTAAGKAARYCSKACCKKAWAQKHFSKPGKESVRRCHDCGRPTPDYRCAACWKKYRSAESWEILEDSYACHV